MIDKKKLNSTRKDINNLVRLRSDNQASKTAPKKPEAVNKDAVGLLRNAIALQIELAK